MAGDLLSAMQIDGGIDSGLQSKEIVVDSLGNKYYSGEQNGGSTPIDFDPGAAYPDNSDLLSLNARSFVVKYNAMDQFQWVRAFSANNLKLAPVGTDGVLVSGDFAGTNIAIGDALLTSNNSAQNDIFLSKLNASGSFVFTTQVTNDPVNSTNRGIAFDASTSSVSLVNSSEPLSNPNSKSITEVRRYLVAGGSAVNAWSGPKQLISTGQSATPVGVKNTSTGQIVVAGIFQGTADFDPGSATYNLSAGPNKDTTAISGYVWTLNASGAFSSAVNFVNQKVGTAVGSNQILGLAIDGSDNIIVGGTYARSVDFDPGVAVQSLANAGDADAYLVKLSPSRGLLWASRFSTADTDRIRAIAADASSGTIYFAVEQYKSSTNVWSSTIRSVSASGVAGWASTIGYGRFIQVSAMTLDNNGQLQLAASFSGDQVYIDPLGIRTNFRQRVAGYSLLFLKIKTN